MRRGRLWPEQQAVVHGLFLGRRLVRSVAAIRPHITPISRKVCRQWSVSMTKPFGRDAEVTGEHGDGGLLQGVRTNTMRKPTPSVSATSAGKTRRRANRRT